jgi:hypothetical protein
LKNPKEFLGRVRWNLWTALNSELLRSRASVHRHLAEFPSRPAETSREREKRGGGGREGGNKKEEEEEKKHRRAGTAFKCK